MSEQEFKKPRQLLDRPFPHPKLPPRNISAGIKGDLPCSFPKCANFCNPRCGFCELHCNRFHNGIHYRKSLKADIPDGIKNYLDLKEGSTLEWEKDFSTGYPRVIDRKKEDNDDPDVQDIIKQYKDITDTDIELVSTQSNVSLELAKKALLENNNDLAKAILSLTTSEQPNRKDVK